MNWEKTHKFDCSMGDHENQFYISCSRFSPIISCFNTLTLKNVYLTQDSTHQNLEIGLAVAGVAPHVRQNPFLSARSSIADLGLAFWSSSSSSCSWDLDLIFSKCDMFWSMLTSLSSNHFKHV